MKKLLIIFAFLFFAGSGNSQVNNLLFEGCTGTWCQWCPCGHQILEGLYQSNPTMLVLEYHGGGGGDPWLNFPGNEIISLLGYTAYPRAAIGRREGNLNRAYWQGAVNNQAGLIPAINLSFSKSYNTSTRQLTVNVTATALRTIDTATKINFTLTESNLIYNQTSNSSCPPGGPTYVHKWVCRSMVNGALGEDFSTGTWIQGTVKNKSWTTTIDAGWNAANIEIGVFVYMNVSGGVLNSQCPVLQTSKSMGLTGINSTGEVPYEFFLGQNYPNPFNPVTGFKFSVPKDGDVKLIVFDMLGNAVDVVWNGFLKSGAYNCSFDGKNLASGTYFYRLTAGNYTSTKKMVLVK
jgi:hypothetical protein